jgi:hypothetical protein
VDLSKTWEEVDWLVIREEMASSALEKETVMLSEEEKSRKDPVRTHQKGCMKKRVVRNGTNFILITRPTSLKTGIT